MDLAFRSSRRRSFAGGRDSYKASYVIIAGWACCPYFDMPLADESSCRRGRRAYALTLDSESLSRFPPLPRGERILESPSLDGRGKGEGGNYLISLTQVIIS
jgi:hypothetical protein